VLKANITEYLDPPNSLCVMENRKFPVQLMADKEECEDNSEPNIIKFGANIVLYILIKSQKSVCSWLLSLSRYGEVKYTIGTHEEMYYRNLSNQPEINSKLQSIY
jgi:hypothetical protein